MNQPLTTTCLACLYYPCPCSRKPDAGPQFPTTQSQIQISPRVKHENGSQQTLSQPPPWNRLAPPQTTRIPPTYCVSCCPTCRYTVLPILAPPQAQRIILPSSMAPPAQVPPNPPAMTQGSNQLPPPVQIGMNILQPCMVILMFNPESPSMPSTGPLINPMSTWNNPPLASVPPPSGPPNMMPGLFIPVQIDRPLPSSSSYNGRVISQQLPPPPPPPSTLMEREMMTAASCDFPLCSYNTNVAPQPPPPQRRLPRKRSRSSTVQPKKSKRPKTTQEILPGSTAPVGELSSNPPHIRMLQSTFPRTLPPPPPSIPIFVSDDLGSLNDNAHLPPFQPVSQNPRPVDLHRYPVSAQPGMDQRQPNHFTLPPSNLNVDPSNVHMQMRVCSVLESSNKDDRDENGDTTEEQQGQLK